MTDDVREVTEAIAARRVSRRRMLGSLGVAGAGLALLQLPSEAEAQTASPELDTAILNFALNLEYLEAEFYLRAIGSSLSAADVGPNPGRVRGGRRVNFQEYGDNAAEIAADEAAHVRFLRAALGSAAVSRPEIDLETSFTAAARAAGVVGPNETFDPYANEVNFLLGAFIFEDVGVTAYKGAAPLLSSKSVLSAAAGILAVEAYHSGEIRTLIVETGGAAVEAANRISDARDSLDGRGDLDQGVTRDGNGNGNGNGGGGVNIVPTDRNGLAFGRTASQVLRIVYLTPARGVSQGGFFPKGVNGTIRTT